MPALDTKAILEGRKPGRHSVGLIIGITISVLCMIVMLAYLLLGGLAGGGAVGVVGFVISLAAAIIPVTILIPLILLLDRLEPEPGSMLLFAFLWGAGVAVLVSLVLNTMGMELYTVPLFGADLGSYLSAAVGAPLVEESAKGAVLLILLWRRRHEIDSYTDGVVYAGMVATGFAFTENISYFLSSFFEQGVGGLVFTFVLRGLIAPFGHPLYTAMIGIGVAHVAINRGAARFLAPVGGWFAAMLLHGLWNGSTIFGYLGLGVAYVVLFFVLVSIIGIAVQDRRRQVAAIARYLPQYIPTGLVTPSDVQMLSSMGGRRRARAWAQRTAGQRGRKAMEDYQLAATELALLHQRLDRGVSRPEWWHRRDSFLALMHVARDAFMGRVQRPVAPSWASAPTDSGFLRRSDFAHVIERAQAQRGAPGAPNPGVQRPATGWQHPQHPQQPPSRPPGW
ncbi:PrsW family intramembrane metalloprotease [Marinitenerispora sediminis]|uniref:PrsW family intramembrane metalloprotease n=1 Tax=Marinitenerispora sediminis TaxID=1931232 RepID=A0A368T6M5_9ACTN|nr:PrsW family intramembrane metalloprotease [Marinitenerispora sediminis]RCV51521.1 PrsW family intramembrane metalloprotease [Marinitenerispora sediminis]RCV55194.1 PrsW family intramembrane metalloprotease [Marinitenerispora sediminis]RCV59134.1 PrsW family intramembrane metalloprotease [Marinitenerispora sediminis]